MCFRATLTFSLLFVLLLFSTSYVRNEHNISYSTEKDSYRIRPFPKDYEKKRIIITTDIGGGDFDDVQSMIHFLLYIDMFDVEAIISGMPRPGGKYWKEILRAYKRDYKNLSFHSADYPTPNKLKKLYKLGSTRKFPGNRLAGARSIIKAARKDDPRPIYVLIWGASTDLAIAVKMKPSIMKKIRPFFIANYYAENYNRAGDPGAYKFLLSKKNWKKIVISDMGRGIYLGGLHGKSKYGNVGFVKKVARKHGKLGKLFYRRSATIDVNKYGIKMGDTPSVFFVMNGDWDDPKKPSWAGKYFQVERNVWTGLRNKSMGRYPGAMHIAKHRVDYLRDFERRLERLDPIEVEE